MNASGIDTMPGLASGNQAKSMFGSIAVFAPDTAGEKMISTIVEISTAVHARQRAAGVEPRPVQRVDDRRQVGRGGHRERQRDEERDVLFGGEDAETIDKAPMTTTVILETRTCSASVTWWLFNTLA